MPTDVPFGSWGDGESWALLHRDELMENWRLLRNNQVPTKVAPLD